MKKYLIGILFLSTLLSLPSRALAVNLSTTTCPGSGCVDYNVSNQASFGVQITGTFVGTITFQASNDNSTFTSLLVYPSSSTTPTTTTTGTGNWATSVAGFKTVRVVFTAYMSGTAVVTPQLSNLSKRLPSAGSGSGTGTVTSVDIDVPAALLAISGGPITDAGTFEITLPTRAKNLVFAGPVSGADATPTFRALDDADLGSVGSSGQVIFNNGAGLTGNAGLTFASDLLTITQASETFECALVLAVASGDNVCAYPYADGSLEIDFTNGTFFTICNSGGCGSEGFYFGGDMYLVPGNKFLAQSGSSFIQFQAASDFTIQRVVTIPTTGVIEPTLIINNGNCLGDNTTLTGCRGILIQSSDDATVSSMTKGYLNGLAISLAPKIARNNSPFDDVTGIHIQNDGTHSGTEFLYFGHSSNALDAVDMLSLWTSEANATYGIRFVTGALGIAFYARNVSTALLDLAAANASDFVAKFAADNNDDATDQWLLKVLATGNSMTWTNNSNVRLTLDTAGVLSPVTIQPTTSYKSVDGTTGATVTTCTGFKNGLCISGT